MTVCLAGVKVHNRQRLIERNRDGLPAWLAEARAFMVAGKHGDVDPATIFDGKAVVEALQP